MPRRSLIAVLVVLGALLAMPASALASADVTNADVSLRLAPDASQPAATAPRSPSGSPSQKRWRSRARPRSVWSTKRSPAVISPREARN